MAVMPGMYCRSVLRAMSRGLAASHTWHSAGVAPTRSTFGRTARLARARARRSLRARLCSALASRGDAAAAAPPPFAPRFRFPTPAASFSAPGGGAWLTSSSSVTALATAVPSADIGLTQRGSEKK